jgi:hypothetical protein
MAYSGRRGPNVSEYIANLNAIPTAQDLQSSEDNFNMEDSLAMFTNTQFFDFDLGHNADLEPTNFPIDKAFGGEGAETVAPGSVDMKPVDYMNGTHLLLHLSSVCSILLAVNAYFFLSTWTVKTDVEQCSSSCPSCHPALDRRCNCLHSYLRR